MESFAAQSLLELGSLSLDGQIAVQGEEEDHPEEDGHGDFQGQAYR